MNLPAATYPSIHTKAKTLNTSGFGLAWFLFLFLTILVVKAAPPKPNIILVMADDQGYGDLGTHGNPWIKTPHLDKLHAESIRLTNYHSGTTCSPTRASLMTGQHFNRVGVWHTIMGRSLLRPGEVTLPEILKKNGYRTAIFGKWHLGDTYPLRPQDRGFEEVVIHGGGGVGQTPDYWNNDYFDDTYFHNGKPQQYKGYCTDVWFAEALRYIQEVKQKPFFIYLPLNAAHEPTHVPANYSQLYQDNLNVPDPDFYGMITNIDDNMGRLLQKLKELNLDQNTILIYTTDNGTTYNAGVQLDQQGFLKGKGFNAGMRGAKGSPYEGGHRVPFFLKYPAGNLPSSRDVSQLVSCMDVLPTLLDLCQVPVPKEIPLDGRSFAPLLRQTNAPWANRTVIVDTQRESFLEKWKKSAVMTEQWRLLNGEELYQIKQDPGQTRNVAAVFPDTVQKLRQQYETWWADISKRQDEYVRIVIGGKENPVTITIHDVHPATKEMPAWHQVMIREGNITSRGKWMVDVAQAGTYEFNLQRWPKETGLPNNASVPHSDPIPGGKPYPAGKAFSFKAATLKVAGQTKQMHLPSPSSPVVFRLPLPAGPTILEAWFTDEQNQDVNAYYVYVKSVNTPTGSRKKNN